MKKKEKRVAVAQGAKQRITIHSGKAKEARCKRLAEVFTLERNAQGDFEIIRVQEGAV